MKGFALALFVLFFSSVSFAQMQMTYPVEITLENVSAVHAGFVEPGQTFDLVFSDNSGNDFEWDKLAISRSSMPADWQVVFTQTDTSLVAHITVPAWAQTNVYALDFGFSNKDNPDKSESVTVRVTVKRNLIDASFVRKSTDDYFFVGGKVLYHVAISNSSISPETVRISPTLPGTWASEKSVSIKPHSVEELDMEIYPQASGITNFSFLVYSANGSLIVDSFSSELNIRPTLKGKFASALSGFPFFTFTLLPFQLFNSFFSFAFE